MDRSGGILTHDPHYPKVVRYQAALRPVQLEAITTLPCQRRRFSRFSSLPLRRSRPMAA